MSVQRPEDWPRAFEEHLNAGDLDGMIELYDPEARFVSRSGDTVIGHERIRPVLAELIRTNTRMQGRVARVVDVGDIALLYTDFLGTTIDVAGRTVEVRSHAIEILRRQPDGTWKLIVGDPNGRAERPRSSPLCGLCGLCGGRAVTAPTEFDFPRPRVIENHHSGEEVHMRRTHAMALVGLAFAATVVPSARAAETSVVTDTGTLDKDDREGVQEAPYSPYAGRNFPTRPFFGDTHLHTVVLDGRRRLRLPPRPAGRLPLRQGRGGRPPRWASACKLSRPLDFLVVSDHSDNMGFFPRPARRQPDDAGRSDRAADGTT